MYVYVCLCMLYVEREENKFVGMGSQTPLTFFVCTIFPITLILLYTTNENVFCALIIMYYVVYMLRSSTLQHQNHALSSMRIPNNYTCPSYHIYVLCCCCLLIPFYIIANICVAQLFRILDENGDAHFLNGLQ